MLRFMMDSHPVLAIPPETGFLKLAPRMKGRPDELREKLFREIVDYPKPVPSWPDFEVPEEAFWAALTSSARHAA